MIEQFWKKKKYEPCGQFVGVKNYNRTVILAGVLVHDETV
jgi:hypothetical protein